MKIFSVDQIRRLDQFTIAHEPIPSIELMERAARTFVKWFTRNFHDTGNRVHVFCGPGNNGGDGLAIARMLSREFYDISAYVLHISPKLSGDFQTNYKNLKKHRCHLREISEGDNFPPLPKGDILIDAIFGSGLNKPVDGYWEKLILYLNQQAVVRVSVDIPSGMFADSITIGTSIHAHLTLSFELPKLGFLFPENAHRVGEWSFESIGLSDEFIEKEESSWHWIDSSLVKPMLRVRGKHDHKGKFGHSLMVVGGYGKVGAAVLSAKGCLRSGAGLVTVHAPQCACEILQIAVPEAMVNVDEQEYFISNISGVELSVYSSIGIGCGIGTNPITAGALESIFVNANAPLVLDADALNLMSRHQTLFSKLLKGSILTPHPKEFERLFGATSDSFARHELQRKKARELGVYIILKEAYTATACPDGNCYFNSSGNPGMATGGSGDVLTGIIAGLLSQGYTQLEASLVGVFLHGIAGDLAADKYQQEAMLAGDIVEFIGDAFSYIRS